MNMPPKHSAPGGYHVIALFTYLMMAIFLLPAICLAQATAHTPASETATQLLGKHSDLGTPGGHLVVSLTTEPKTFNPATLSDDASKAVVNGMVADLIHINRSTQLPEPSLAKSWNISADGRKYTIKLRPGLHFSDGFPLTADDVLFSFNVYLDERVHSPQRDLLVIDDKPIAVKKIDVDTIVFELSKPYGPGVRLFDSFAILPRHLLDAAFRKGTLAQSWTTASPPSEIAGAGPFRLKQYIPGQKLILEKNPFYWKMDQRNVRLPYLDQLVFLFIPNQDAAFLRFQSGEIDLLNHMNPRDFTSFQRDAHLRNALLLDAGSSLEWNFLLFNLNDPAKLSSLAVRSNKWFSSVAFRQAVSAAVDRESIVRLIYQGKATPIWGPVTPGNKLWMDPNLSQSPRSLNRARQLLRDAKFSWAANGDLLDPEHQPVRFSIVVASSNLERIGMATIIQEDLRQIGMRVSIVPLEFRALLNRILDTHDYETCILGLGSGDTDPNADSNVWLSNGETHLWNLHRGKPATNWEAEIDDLMHKQLSELSFSKRKAEFDRVQELLSANQPLVFLVSPNVLVAVKSKLGNFRPVVMDPSDLWNVDELYWKSN
jgi:peptide/nickel transport system substrate-binding protein